MKILQINSVYKKMATGINVYEMNKTYTEQGHRCIAAYSEGTFNAPEEYHVGNVIGQKTHALLSRITGLQGYFSSGATKKLLRYMDEFCPDVVVLNNLHANYIHLPMLLQYLAQRDIPTVAVLHDCWFFTGKCCYYTSAGCDKWKTQCGKCPIYKKYNKSWIWDRTRKMHVDRKRLFGAIPRLGVVGVSDWILSEARQAPVFRNAKLMERVYNWIDTDVFKPVDTAELRKKLHLENKKVLLAVSASWEMAKGLGPLMQIAKHLKEDECLVMVGSPKKNMELPNNVIQINRTHDRDELVRYYSMADVFLQPSLAETFGKVTAEALCCGTPVVCSDSTANPELVGENCGAVVPVGDADAMLRAAREILQKGKPHYTQACRSFAESQFNMGKCLQQYMELFHKLQACKAEGR